MSFSVTPSTAPALPDEATTRRHPAFPLARTRCRNHWHGVRDRRCGHPAPRPPHVREVMVLGEGKAVATAETSCAAAATLAVGLRRIRISFAGPIASIPSPLKTIYICIPPLFAARPQQKKQKRTKTFDEAGRLFPIHGLCKN